MSDGYYKLVERLIGRTIHGDPEKGLSLPEAYEEMTGDRWVDPTNNLPPSCSDVAALFSPNAEESTAIDIVKKRESLMKHEEVRRKLRELSMSDQAFAVAQIYQIVWEAARPALWFRPVVKNVINIDKPILRVIRAILVPRAFFVGEAGEIPAANEKYDNVDATVQKLGIRPLISREMIEDAVWDIIGRQIAEAARAVAQLENEQFLAGGETSAGNPSGATGSMLGDFGNSVTATTAGQIAFADLANMIGALRAQNFYFNGGYLVTNPNAEANLIKDATLTSNLFFGQFLAKDQPPTRFFLSPLGMQVFVSTIMGVTSGSGATILVDPDYAGEFIIRRDLTVENLVDPSKDLTGMALTERVQYATLRANAITKLVSGP